MKCSEVAKKLETLRPDIAPGDIARMATILCTSATPNQLHCDASFLDLWNEAVLRLQAATDQHAAATEELNELAGLDPQEFEASQIWVLIRSIKVQNHLLKLSVGESVVG